MVWLLYNILFTIGYLLVLPRYLVRMRRRGGYGPGFLQRLGIFTPEIRKRLAGRRRFWIHAVSVGEVYVAIRFMDAIRATDQEACFLLTTTTSTGHRVASDALHPDDILLYFPVDFPFVVRRALRLFNPRALLLVENELWPNLLREAKRNAVPVILINGRISDSSYRGYRRLRWMTQRALRFVDLFLVQSGIDRSRLTDIGAEPKRVKVVGNAKYDAVEDDPEAERKARAILESAGIGPMDRILLGGSTWPGEETALLDIFKSLKPAFPDLKLVLVPRHMERRAEVEVEVARAGYPYLLRSAAQDGQKVRNADILLVDTTGELKSLYAAASVIFVGKSLTCTGGQNFIEPALLGKAIVVGPHLENFPGVANDFRAADAMVQVQSVDALQEKVASLLADERLRAEYGRRARELVAGKRGAIASSVRMILDLIS